MPRLDMPRIEDETIPVNANLKSEHRTAASVSFDGHWDLLGLPERWNWPRYANLCAMLDLTIYEMGSLVMLPHHEVDRFHRNNRLFPADRFHAKQVGLILTLLEQHYMKDFTREKFTNPFPNVGVTA